MRLRSLSLLALLAVSASCTPTDPSQPSVPAEEEFAPFLQVDIPNMVKISDDLYYKDIFAPTEGPVATGTSLVAITYSGYLKTGQLFDSNVGQDSLEIRLNNAQLVAGWQVGIPGMRPGGIRKLVVGSSLGYGAAGKSVPGFPEIPPHATLVFNVRLIHVK